MNFEDWIRTVPEEITGDSLWKVEAYRLALFVVEIGWLDVTRLMKDKRTLGLSDQLYRSLGSISANIAEGYSRGTSKDRAHFYEYSLGSAREARDWYYKSNPVLGETVVTHRLKFLTHIIRLLLAMVPQQRGYSIHESTGSYATISPVDVAFPIDLEILLTQIPVP